MRAENGKKENMRIAIIGYGKMGHIIEDVARSRGHEICCIIDKDNLSDFDSESFAAADVAIEFSAPQAAQGNIKRAWQHHKPVVSGTTGWQVKDLIDEVQTNGEALFWTSNYSIGVNLFFALNQYLAQIIRPYSYEPSITEIHHIHKLDAPSGTAKTLAEDMAQELGRTVPIESIREGEVPGTHTVKYESETDGISITHEAHSRYGFALGALLAAEYIVGKKGYHTMTDLIKL